MRRSIFRCLPLKHEESVSMYDASSSAIQRLRVKVSRLILRPVQLVCMVQSNPTIANGNLLLDEMLLFPLFRRLCDEINCST